jgi:hypothetical protein
LLENVGAEIDPIRLIRRIKNGLEIPGLKPALIKILHDFNLQISLLEGCQAILHGDSSDLAKRLHRDQTSGFLIACKSSKALVRAAMIQRFYQRKLSAQYVTCLYKSRRRQLCYFFYVATPSMLGTWIAAMSSLPLPIRWSPVSLLEEGPVGVLVLELLSAYSRSQWTFHADSYTMFSTAMVRAKLTQGCPVCNKEGHRT